jgi:dUTP pyrophosphatase
MIVTITNDSLVNEVPLYATEGSAGMDLQADIRESITIKPTQRVLVPTNIKIALPEGYEAQVRPRSGLAYKHGITVLNSPGTIDSDYRGSIGVILINHGDTSFTINNGDRIAQLVVAKYEKVQWLDSSESNLVSQPTARGEGGFGSTGLQ